MNVCFTGHRPKDFGGWNVTCPQHVSDWLEEYIDKLINLKDDVTFISGAAQGIDQWAADIVLRKKEQNKNVKLLMAIPYYDFGDNWPLSAQQHLEEINNKADQIHYVHKGKFTSNYLLQVRNEWMVDRSQLVLAVWNGSLGGTRNCVKYAEKLERKIIRFNPLTKETIKIKYS
jgi:uncharacterized phage-like protein YoqJ